MSTPVSSVMKSRRTGRGSMHITTPLDTSTLSSTASFGSAVNSPSHTAKEQGYFSRPKDGSLVVRRTLLRYAPAVYHRRRAFAVVLLCILLLPVFLVPLMLVNITTSRGFLAKGDGQRAEDANHLRQMYEAYRAGSRGASAALLPTATEEARVQQCRRLYEVAGVGGAAKETAEAAPDSTILMTFAAGDPPQYRYVPPLSSAGVGGVGGGQCTPLHDAGYLGGGFARVAASQLSTPYAASAAAGGDADAVVPFFDFFRSHGATLWEVREGAAERVAAPLQMDVVYTYVNPTAPSFARHLKERDIPARADQRYNDWEELRYSLRTLHKRILNSDALQQYTDRLKEDVGALEALGYRVDLSTRRTPWNRNGTAAAPGDALSGDAFPLFRTVYLLLSDEDQVPAWLNAAAFPQLRVVTHDDMFKGEAGVLPTMNSNVIESGLHRIPGISRHFLYLNNDFFIGRQASVFDLFRPLSPSRQQLRVVHDELTSRGMPAAADGDGGSRRCAEALGSRFMYMEAIGHSHTTYRPWDEEETTPEDGPTLAGKARVRQQESQCLREEARHLTQRLFSHQGRRAPVQKELRGKRTSKSLGRRGPASTSAAADKLLSSSGNSRSHLFSDHRTASHFLSRKPLRTTSSFAILKGDGVPTSFASGIASPYYDFKAMERLDGVRPPWGYPHMPHLFDREVFRRLTEDVYGAETAQMRRAFKREMSPFSVVHMYAPTALAFARSAAREQWGRVMALTSSSASTGGDGGGVHAAVAGWLAAASGRVVAAAEAGALHLPRESRALSEEAMAALGPLYGGSWGVRLQAPELLPGELGLWWLPGARPAHVERRTEDSLRPLYAVPDLVVVRRDGCVPSQAATYPRIVENYWALYHDIMHYVRPGPAYQFWMLDGPLKALVMTQRCVDESAEPALWRGFNDDFTIREGVEGEGDALRVRAAVRLLFDTCLGDLPAAPWER